MITCFSNSNKICIALFTLLMLAPQKSNALEPKSLATGAVLGAGVAVLAAYLLTPSSETVDNVEKNFLQKTKNDSIRIENEQPITEKALEDERIIAFLLELSKSLPHDVVIAKNN